MNKKDLREDDICAKFITPAIVQGGWDEITQIRRQAYFTKGRITVKGKLVTRGKAKFADYLLFYKANIPIAVIEAKDNNHSVGDGMQQALGYSETLQVPFVFSSNGDGFVFHDKTGTAAEVEQNLDLGDFPNPAMLWAKYCAWKGITSPEAEALVLQDYYDGKEPRYYQRNAINAATEAIARAQERLLIVMATGTGKTFTAFQIVWRLWKAGRKKRVLYLADRNVLIDQTMVNDFRPFGSAMAKLSASTKTIQGEEGAADIIRAIDKMRKIDTSFEIYLGLYQAITGPEERQKLFKKLSPGFFDLIVIDECHRGSAADDAAWHEILEYFSSATQIGMTATPKETEYASNTAYFGDPVYFYSLREGIADGFLAPYKVVKKAIDSDVVGYRPEPGKTDIHGELVEDRVYNQTDMERTLVIDERTRLVAKEVTDFLKDSGDRFQKTMVFCVDREHAARMRQALINENADLVQQNAKYVVRITSGDEEGIAELDNFMDPESKYPVIVTTSRLLSTGVDVQTCRLIVIDRSVQSMTEFKQIIGRGTRIHEETGKYYFTIMDFRQATDHFADPDFDGKPIPNLAFPGPPKDAGVEDAGDEPETDETILAGGEIEPNPIQKTYIDGVEVQLILNRVQYLDAHGRLITESLRTFTRTALLKRFASLDQFLQTWNGADRKQVIVEELADEGLLLEALADEINRDLDPFDLICYVAFDRKPLTRKERAENVRKRDVFAKYGPQARAVLDALLSKYEDGLSNIEDPRILQISPLDSLGTPLQLVNEFGGLTKYQSAVAELEAALYEEAA